MFERGRERKRKRKEKGRKGKERKGGIVIKLKFMAMFGNRDMGGELFSFVW